MLSIDVPSIVVVLLLALLVSFISDIVKLRRFIVRGGPRRPCADLSAVNVQPEGAAAQMIDQLLALGFRRLGEAGPWPTSSYVAWYLADQDGTTVVAVSNIGRGSHATMYSWFGDEACIVYSFPLHDQIIRQHGYRYRALNTTVDTAYSQFLRHARDFTEHFGPARRLDSMAEILRLDTIYNQRFARYRMRPAINRAGIKVAAVLVMIAIVMAVFRPRFW